jgi:cytochrome b
MNMPSASRSDPTPGAPAALPPQGGDAAGPAKPDPGRPLGSRLGNSNSSSILVWDAPVRVFHWLMVLCFAGAWLTAESEHWRLLHVTLGYTVAALVAFRLVWGLVGTRYARFSAFVRGPAAVSRYLRSMVQDKPEHHIGHNPAGALAILALLGLAVLVTATGWANFNEIALPWPEKWTEELHEGAASTMLALVGLHVLAVVVSSRLHGENLARAMVTGRKAGPASDGIRSAWRSVAALMLAAVLGFWWLQWQSAPSAPAPQTTQSLDARPAG